MFQAIILSKEATDKTRKLTIYENEIKTTKFAKLLGVEIDYQIRFNEHTSTLCSKAVTQLNALYKLHNRMQIFMGKTEKRFNE